MKRIGVMKESRHTYLFGVFFNEWDPRMIDEARGGPLPHHAEFAAFRPRLPLADLGIQMVKVWDYDFQAAQRFASAFNGVEAVRDRAEMLDSGLDGIFLSESFEDGIDHRALAEPFLKAGIPVFVDKPFASTLADARALVATAKEAHTAVMSASLLGQTPTAARLREEAKRINACTLTVAGFGPLISFGVHLVSICHAVFGTDVRAVHNVGTVECDHVRLLYGVRDAIEQAGRSYEPRSAVLHVLHEGAFFDYDVALYGSGGQVLGKISRVEYLNGVHGLILLFKKMVETKKSPIPYETQLEELKILHAAKLSRALEREVALAELD